MFEVMQAKRKATEQSIEESKSKQPLTESVEERQKRLIA
jgi:hypothetical protein